MNSRTVPIIVDLGKQKKRPLRELIKQGRGRLMEEVKQVISDVESGLGDQRANKLVVPIVVVYKRKKRQAGGLLG